MEWAIAYVVALVLPFSGPLPLSLDNDPGCHLDTHSPCAGAPSPPNCRCQQAGEDCPVTYTRYLAPDIRYVNQGATNTENKCYKYVEGQIDCYEIIGCPDAGEHNCQVPGPASPNGSCSFGQGEDIDHTYRIQGYWVVDGTCDPPTGACLVE
ncbi:MAG: hypothetical protein BroJett003_27430 [Planctomycetota bacterium]|nr:MAG: hypothetical protein BroJett003_27430 [Planctomycetota bacterium]